MGRYPSPEHNSSTAFRGLVLTTILGHWPESLPRRDVDIFRNTN